MSKFEVKEMLPLTDGAAVDLLAAMERRRQVDRFRAQDSDPERCCPSRAAWSSAGARRTPLDLCNKGATITQGRAAFFAQDDFAFVSNRSGSPAVWRADLGKGLVEQLTLPFADEADYGPTARPDSDGHFAFFRIIGAGKPHLFVGRLGETNQPLATGRLDGDQPWFMPMATRLIFHSTRDGDHGVFEMSTGPPRAEGCRRRMRRLRSCPRSPHLTAVTSSSPARCRVSARSTS